MGSRLNSSSLIRLAIYSSSNESSLNLISIILNRVRPQIYILDLTRVTLIVIEFEFEHGTTRVQLDSIAPLAVIEGQFVNISTLLYLALEEIWLDLAAINTIIVPFFYNLMYTYMIFVIIKYNKIVMKHNKIM